mgnify:FL=1
MEKAAPEVLKKYVNSQKFTSTAEVMEAMKTMFADVLQQVMSVELDETLGYEKSERLSQDAENGTMLFALKSQYSTSYSQNT